MNGYKTIDAVIKNGRAVPADESLELLPDDKQVQIVVGNVNARKRFMDFGSIAGLLLAFISVLIGVLDCSTVLDIPNGLAFLIVGFWVIVPPVFLWLDWILYCLKIGDERFRDDAQHTHNLARNIWLALVLILVSLFDLTGKFS